MANTVAGPAPKRAGSLETLARETFERVKCCTKAEFRNWAQKAIESHNYPTRTLFLEDCCLKECMCRESE